MRTKEEIIKELEKSLHKALNSKQYAERNSTQGYMKALLFCLGIDTSKNVNLYQIVRQTGIFLKFEDKYKLQEKLPNIFS